MRARRTTHKLIATVLAALLLAVPVLPAFASEPPTEPTIGLAVTAAGASLQGLTATQAVDPVVAAFGSPHFGPLPAVADGHVFSIETSGVLTLDVTATVAAAFAATEATALVPVYVVNAPKVVSLVAGIAAVADRPAVNAKRVVSKRRFTVTAPAFGLAVDRPATAALLAGALASMSTGSAAATVTAPTVVVAPKITVATVGKTIVVVLGQFKVYVFNGAKLEKTYRCAIGMNRYPTPVGVFKIVRKSAAPAWGNPYSSWSLKMPKAIRPGYYNPLGLRALYLSAAGIRIHGTAKTSSMGHKASHGCVRLTNKDVVNLYPRVQVGTPVYIVR
jgi:lipoprotein-anchoring transpeptidase ErfK/SrfK